MVTHTIVYIPHTSLMTYEIRQVKRHDRLIPPPRMLLPVGLILAGVSIPVLMVLQILTPTLLMGFAGFALTLTGGTLALIFCGEL